ncbi:MAG: GNAT family acetyltransferase [candidate division WS6 bacterium 34_10]|jgi:predicted N-acetyltransferase YhbS|uniref:GNAT family acetyltransferase n=1 Tax=candidate division WS6 bacterium 34_10 TaxID=1641389 RepID=A0A101HJ03_9BACT|nr:MAG: GNAT family acetyltransferase [candidate division WS6 bacterium 34_10]MDY6822120.1 GNAT family N-acetyltransferase [Deferribacterota bacterium]
MEIRRATKDDIESIQYVIRESILATHKDIYPQEDMEETVNNYTVEKLTKYITNYDYFVAEEDGDIVGCVLAKKDKMRSLYVLPSHMGKGLGRKLAQTAEKCIEDNGYKRIWLWSSLIAHDFYKHLGYKDVKEIPNKDGLVLHIEMEKYL